MQKFLVAIASYGAQKSPHLPVLLNAYREMGVSVVVNTPNRVDLGPGVKVVTGLPDPNNPWSLTWAHKHLFSAALDSFDHFLYVEDDILVSAENIRAWMDAAPHLRPYEVAAFVRYEVDSQGRLSYPDMHDFYYWDITSVEKRGPYRIAKFSNLHSGCYLLSKSQLKHCLKSKYVRPVERSAKYGYPETAATDPFGICALSKVTVISFQHTAKFLVHHLGDKYVGQGKGLDDETFQEHLGTLNAVQEGCIMPNPLPRTRSTHWRTREKEEQGRFLRAYRFIMRPKKVSIGLPVYNGEKYLASAIESILCQEHQNFELIISDNASTDSTSDIIASFKDDRIRSFRNTETVSIVNNHNRVFDLARGEYFKWAGHDDIYAPDFLAQCLAAFRPDVCAVYTGFQLIDEAGLSIGYGRIDKVACDGRVHERLQAVYRNIGAYSAFFSVFRSDVLRLTGLGRPFPDWDKVMLIELAALGILRLIDQPLMHLRVHENGSRFVSKRALHKQLGWRHRLPERLFTDLKILQSLEQLPLKDRAACKAVMIKEMIRKRALSYTFGIRKRIGLAPSVRKAK
jgi:glycosyltransferase involved in cell wall biosynthesis